MKRQESYPKVKKKGFFKKLENIFSLKNKEEEKIEEPKIYSGWRK